MTQVEKIELYNELVETYGQEHQCMIAIEEMAELTKELVKFERGFFNHNEIAEEIADVEIMLEQVKRIYGISDCVEQWKDEKLNRTQARLQMDKILHEKCDDI